MTGNSHFAPTYSCFLLVKYLNKKKLFFYTLLVVQVLQQTFLHLLFFLFSSTALYLLHCISGDFQQHFRRLLALTHVGSSSRVREREVVEKEIQNDGGVQVD